MTSAPDVAKDVVDALRFDRKSPIAELVKKLAGETASITVENCLSALSSFVAVASHNQKKHLSEIAKAMMGLVPSRKCHDFAKRAVAGKLLGIGRLHTAVKLDYFLFPAELLIDGLFVKTDQVVMKVAVKMFLKSEVLRIVRLVSENYDKLEVVVEKMKSIDIFENYELGGNKDIHVVRKFIVTVCEFADEPLPAEARRVVLLSEVEKILVAYGKNEAEDQDIFPLFRLLADGRDEDQCLIIASVSAKFPSLASFVSERFGGAPIPYDDEFVPRCAQPYNEKLHQLRISGEVVIKDPTHVANFKTHLERSNYFAIDFHGVYNPGKSAEVIAMVSFCLRSKVYFLMPELFPETVAPISEALKAAPKPTFVFRWGRRQKACLDLFGWTPSELHEMEKVAKGRGVGDGFDDVTERTVGGAFCKRAGWFSGQVIPSAQALEHRAIRVTLIYEFVVKELKLRERTEKRKPSRYDRKEEPEERRRKYARESERRWDSSRHDDRRHREESRDDRHRYRR